MLISHALGVSQRGLVDTCRQPSSPVARPAGPRWFSAFSVFFSVFLPICYQLCWHWEPEGRTYALGQNRYLQFVAGRRPYLEALLESTRILEENAETLWTCLAYGWSRDPASLQDESCDKCPMLRSICVVCCWTTSKLKDSCEEDSCFAPRYLTLMNLITLKLLTLDLQLHDSSDSAR